MKIVEHLIKNKVVTKKVIKNALLIKGKDNAPLINRLFDLECIDDQKLLEALSEMFEIPVVDLADTEVDHRAFDAVGKRLVKRHGVLPIRIEGAKTLILAVSNPLDVFAFDDIREATSLILEFKLASKKQIVDKIDGIINGNKFDETLEKTAEFSKSIIALSTVVDEADEFQEEEDDSVVINLVNAIIRDAVKEKASDIHIDPKEKCVELRYRVDGVLRIKAGLPKNIQCRLMSRLKIMANLDIAESRRPQDGRFKTKQKGQNIDMRISIIPTIFGEKIVLRILDSSERKVDLDQLGLQSEDKAMLKRMINQPQGLVLVSGPTGSGKTSTLYGALKTIVSKEKNIITIEDPVEYVLEGINQIQVNEKIGVTFADGLRSILRQDPDCILVGEIRDQETADMAFRASLTGHLVFSTVHTNSVFSTITRLRDIGMDSFVIASSLLGIVSQRLIRLNCTHCVEPYQPERILVEKYRHNILSENENITFYKGIGCKKCNGSGYKDRIAVFEILPINSKIRQLITKGASEAEIKQVAKKQNFCSIVDDAMTKVLKGTTTLEEVERVLGNHEKMDEDNVVDIDAFEPIIDENLNIDMESSKAKPRSYIRKSSKTRANSKRECKTYRNNISTYFDHFGISPSS